MTSPHGNYESQLKIRMEVTTSCALEVYLYSVVSKVHASFTQTYGVRGGLYIYYVPKKKKKHVTAP